MTMTTETLTNLARENKAHAIYVERENKNGRQGSAIFLVPEADLDWIFTSRQRQMYQKGLTLMIKATALCYTGRWPAELNEGDPLDDNDYYIIVDAKALAREKSHLNARVFFK